MNNRYMMRGVSAAKEDVHNAIKNIDKGVFPQAFCKIIPDVLGGDPDWCNIMHADGAGTKSSLAYMYWKETGDTSVFDADWLAAVGKILDTFTDQQRKTGKGNYRFMRETHRASDTQVNDGYGSPWSGCGLIVSSFRPSDDATVFQFLIPSNFFAVSSLRKAAEILTKVNGKADLAAECTALADEVAGALQQYAVVEHPEFGKIYAFEVDGFGSTQLMDDANVPSLLAMPYLGDVERTDPIYENTRRFVWSTENPYFWRGAAGEGIGGPHIGVEMIWPCLLYTSPSPRDA